MFVFNIFCGLQECFHCSCLPSFFKDLLFKEPFASRLAVASHIWFRLDPQTDSFWRLRDGSKSEQNPFTLAGFKACGGSSTASRAECEPSKEKPTGSRNLEHQILMRNTKNRQCKQQVQVWYKYRVQCKQQVQVWVLRSPQLFISFVLLSCRLSLQGPWPNLKWRLHHQLHRIGHRQGIWGDGFLPPNLHFEYVCALVAYTYLACFHRQEVLLGSQSSGMRHHYWIWNHIESDCIILNHIESLNLPKESNSWLFNANSVEWLDPHCNKTRLVELHHRHWQPHHRTSICWVWRPALVLIIIQHPERFRLRWIAGLGWWFRCSL